MSPSRTSRKPISARDISTVRALPFWARNIVYVIGGRLTVSFPCLFIFPLDSTFDGADFTNAIVDRASFKGSSLRGTIFTNAVLTGTTFDNADLENADFTDAYIGNFDIKNICKNPTLKGENPTTGADTRMSVGCGPS